MTAGNKKRLGSHPVQSPADLLFVIFRMWRGQAVPKSRTQHPSTKETPSSQSAEKSSKMPNIRRAESKLCWWSICRDCRMCDWVRWEYDWL